MSLQPQVEFHTGRGDPIGFACRLLRKALRQGVRLVVSAEAGALRELDRALWTFDERDFIPHLLVDGRNQSAAIARRTPLWLVDALPAAPHPPVLVNLGGAIEDWVDRFERVIEIVPIEEEAAARARWRWRLYKERGLAVVHHGAEAG